MAKKPQFNDASWDTTVWSLWGRLYTGAASDTALRAAISQTFGEAKKAMSALASQVDPTAALIQEWRTELSGYARTITYGEANDVLLRLRYLLQEATRQNERDRELLKANVKLPAPSQASDDEDVAPRRPAKNKDKAEKSEEDRYLEWMVANSGGALGHGAATAKQRPALVKAQPKPPQTAAEMAAQRWVSRQREMANDCDSLSNFNQHAPSDTVVDVLDLDARDGRGIQYQTSDGHAHKRVIVTQNRVHYWTLGLSHRERRDVGHYSVYRREGGSNRFTFVSGERDPNDPGP